MPLYKYMKRRENISGKQIETNGDIVVINGN